MNASTFSGLVTASTLADPYTVISSSIGTLKGPLHGGANEAVIHMLNEIGTTERVPAYIEDKLKAKEKIMGFGHRVYKVKDPRAIVLQGLAQQVEATNEAGSLFKIARAVEHEMERHVGQKGIRPNVDFYSGILYHRMGIETDLFTPIFAMARVAGWLAHCFEQYQENHLFRPAQIYEGLHNQPYEPLESREGPVIVVSISGRSSNLHPLSQHDNVVVNRYMIAVHNYDVLVMGAGLAGMRAALSAHQQGASVAILTKVHPVRSHSNAAQGGINAALTDRGDKWEEHAFETVKGSDYLADQDAVEVLAQEAGHDIIALEHMGVIFNRNEEGRLGTRRFGGQQRARTFFVSDFTGQAMLHVLFEQILQAKLPVFEEWFVTSIVKDENGHCAGVVAFEIRTGEFALFKAKAVILAAGGLGRVYEPSTNALICTGDGMALAYQIRRSALMDMEMVQYHPTTLKGKGLLISEAARGEGAYLLNREGDRFMEWYAPNMMELASRDVVSRAEQIEINEGRGVNSCVLLDCRHLGKSFIHDRLRQINEEAKTFANIDLAEEPIPIRPGMHYQMGGIKTDTDGRCWDLQGKWRGVQGLFAAGEAACVSLHGGNRLGANSLLDTVVFGRRAGKCAADYCERTTESKNF